MCSFCKRTFVGYAFNQCSVELYTVKSSFILFPWSSASETFVTNKGKYITLTTQNWSHYHNKAKQNYISKKWTNKQKAIG